MTIKASVQKNDKTYYVTEVESFGGDPDEWIEGAPVTSVTIEDNPRLTLLPDGVFVLCTMLTEVRFNEGLTEIPIFGAAACECLETVYLPSTLTVINMGAFNSCFSLTTVELPDGVMICDSAFANTGLTSITITADMVLDPEGANFFSGCEGLETATITADYIPAELFAYSSSLTTVSIDAVMIGTSAFEGCGALSTVNLSERLESVGANAFKGCTSITTINLPGSVETIASSAFMNCTGLMGITIPSGVSSLGTEVFRGCTSLSSVDLGGCTNISIGMFQGCSSLTSIDLTNVTSIGSNAFLSCTGLTNVIIPSTVTSIGPSAFRFCSSLSAITLGENVITIGSAAFGRTALTTITIPASVTTIDFTPNEEDLVFPSTLESINVANNNANYMVNDGILYTKDEQTILSCPMARTGELVINANVGNYAFYKTNLSKVVFTNNVTTVGNHAFYKSTTLREVILSESITQLKGFSLYGCNQLEALSLPAGITLMGPSTLPPDLKYISFPSDVSGDVFNTVTSLWGNSVRMYDADGITLIKDNEIEKIRGHQFVWDGVNARNLYIIADDQALFTVTVGNSTTYEAVTKGTVRDLVSPAATAHMVFAGWFSDPDFTVTHDPSLPINGDTSVFALFSPEMHTVTYMVGEEVVGVVENYEYGADVSVRDAYNKAGYTVGAWVSENVTPVGGNFVIGDIDIIFTATCVVNQYTITFDTVGGSAISAITQDYNSDVVAPADPTKTGYRFAGWSVGIPAKMPVDGMTVTATWIINQYTITFDTVGGSAISAITQDYNSDVVAPSVEPSKEGYRFIKWDSEVPATMPASDITIKAVWAIMANADKDGLSAVELDSNTDSFIPSVETKVVTVKMANNTSVKVEDASDLAGKTVVSKVESVSNETGIKGTAYEFTFTANGTSYNGKIQVTLPYVKEDKGEPVVYFWNGSESTKMKVISSTDTSVTFETDHNSMYVVASETYSNGDGSDFMLYFGILMAASIAIAILVGFCFYHKKA